MIAKKREFLRASPLSLFFLPLFVLSACGTHEPTGQDVLDRYFNAVGGKETLQAFKSVTTKGAFALPEMGYNGEFTSHIKPPNLAIQQISLGGTVVASSGLINGVAWQTNPMTGPQILKGAAARGAIRAAALDPVLPWTENLQSAQLQDWSAEALTAKVLLRQADGDQAICEFDQKTGFLSAMITFTGDQRTMTSYSDYRAVEGVAVAHKIQTDAGGQAQLEFVISEVAHDQDLPDSTFEPPPDIKPLMAPQEQ
jgi:hypothetical protein